MVRKHMLVLFGALALAACGGGGAAPRDPGAVAAMYEGPIRSADVEHGHELYDSVCMSCHGGGAPGLDNLGWAAGRMRQQIREGEGRMPAIPASRLSDDDLEAVLAYMVTVGAVQGEPAAQRAEQADPAEE